MPGARLAARARILRHRRYVERKSSHAPQSPTGVDLITCRTERSCGHPSTSTCRLHHVHRLATHPDNAKFMARRVAAARAVVGARFEMLILAGKSRLFLSRSGLSPPMPQSKIVFVTSPRTKRNASRMSLTMVRPSDSGGSSAGEKNPTSDVSTPTWGTAPGSDSHKKYSL